MKFWHTSVAAWSSQYIEVSRGFTGFLLFQGLQAHNPNVNVLSIGIQKIPNFSTGSTVIVMLSLFRYGGFLFSNYNCYNNPFLIKFWFV